MFAVYEWIVENYQLFIAVGVLIMLLGLSGNISVSLRNAKKGLNEAMTPLGFLILLGLAYVLYQIYLAVVETL